MNVEPVLFPSGKSSLLYEELNRVLSLKEYKIRCRGLAAGSKAQATAEVRRYKVLIIPSPGPEGHNKSPLFRALSMFVR